MASISKNAMKKQRKKIDAVETKDEVMITFETSLGMAELPLSSRDCRFQVWWHGFWKRRVTFEDRAAIVDNADPVLIAQALDPANDKKVSFFDFPSNNSPAT